MARKQIKVTVEPSDIQWGARKDSHRCMVSRALMRAVPGATRPDTDNQSIRFTSPDGERLVYLTPLVVQNYVAAFDRGDAIDPFSFTLRNPMIARRRRVVPEDLAKEAKRSRAKRSPAVPVPVAPPTGTKSTKGKGKRSLPAASNGGLGPIRSVSSGGRKPPPRVYRTSSRAYGHRVLAINQHEDDE